MNDYDNTNQKAYLTFSINETGNRKAAPVDLTWEEVNSIELTQNGTLIKTWTETDSYTAYAQMKADSSVILDAGTYNFAISLKDLDGDILQSGKLDNVEIKPGANPLNFKTKAMLEGKGNLTIGIKWLAGFDAKYIKEAEIKLYNMDMEQINNVVFEKQENPFYLSSKYVGDLPEVPENYTSGIYENIDCGNYIVKIHFVVDKSSESGYSGRDNFEKQTIELVEIQNKRDTKYIYEHNIGASLFPVEFKDEEGNPVTFIDGYTPPAYANEKELPSTDKIVIPADCMFEGWYVDNDKITSFDFIYDGKCTIVAKYKHIKTTFDTISDNDYLFVTNADDISTIVSKLTIEPKEERPANITIDLSDLSITEIGAQTFQNCSTLTEIILPESITKLGRELSVAVIV